MKGNEGEEMNAAIEVLDLRKRYGDVVAVDGVSFQVAPGEVFGLLGPNGAGKTTTVECLLGLRTQDSGTVRLLGMEHGWDSGALKARLGAQLQTTGFLPRLTVREQLGLFAALFPAALPVDQLLDRVGLREKAKAQTKSLSGGQRQRLALAVALVNDPDVIFLDEPTTGLDPQARRGLWDIVRQVQAAGKAVLLTTHYMEEAEQLCDRVAIMDRGKVIGLDSPAALINRYFKETAIELVPTNGSDRSRLAGLPAVGQTASQNGHVTVYSSDVPRTMAGLFQMVSDGSFSFKDLAVRQATLEDLFLKLTGRRIRE
jgi:ABC-2 type transport system ATP-binding protein